MGSDQPIFFKADQHARICFQSIAVKRFKADTLKVRGNLTRRGQIHLITVAAMQTSQDNDPGGNYRFGFETAFTIKRHQWGMDFMRNGLSDAVEIVLNV